MCVGHVWGDAGGDVCHVNRKVSLGHELTSLNRGGVCVAVSVSAESL